MNHSQALRCPLCESDNVSSSSHKRTVVAPLGVPVAYDHHLDVCAKCGEKGDFSKANDVRIQKAEAESATLSVGRLLDDLASRGISPSYIERAMAMPALTVARWRDGTASAEALALLRVIHTYPWILEVADRRFEKRP